MTPPLADGWAIAVVRTPDELQELRIVPTSDFAPFAHRSSRDKLVSDRDRLQTSWRALGRVTRSDAETLVHLVNVLLGTVPWTLAPSRLAIPDLGSAVEAAPRATAAHPRAYRGTKHKPPKARRLEPVDLRPYLNDPAQLRVVLQAFAPAFEGARAELLASGVHEDRIGLLGEAIAAGVDPFVAYHVGKIRRRIASDLFRTHILPSCRGATTAELTEALSLHEQLRFDARPEVLAAVSALFAATGPRMAIRWCRAMSAEPEEDQPLFAAHLIASRAFEQEPEVIRAGDLERLRELAPEGAYRSWHCSLFRAVARGIPMAYLFTGFALARDRDPRFDFDKIEPCFDFPGDTFPVHLAKHEPLSANDDDPRFWLRVWEHSAALPGLGALVAKIPWDELGSEVVRAYVKIFEHLIWMDGGAREKKAKWKAIVGNAAALLARILVTPPAHRLKAISYFSEAVWRWDTPAELGRVLPRMLLVAERLARPPFGTDPDATQMLSSFFAHGSDEITAAFLAAPDTSFRRLSAAFRRTNDAWSVKKGLSALIISDGALLVESFREQPARLFAASRALGSLSKEAGLAVARRLAEHPLSAPVAGAAAILQRLEELGEAEGLPGKIRRLRPEDGERLARAEPALRKHLLAARLATLERIAREALAGDLGADLADRNAVHALEIMAEGNGNRRALRRFLDAHFKGDTGYVARHHETRVWLAKHPKLNVRLWTEGIETTRDIAPHGPVRVTTEQDPLEALKLGTYAGSCLAPGGLCTYSAASVALDINKQVLYARDARRTVVGRQLVAISREGELVCFGVYPLSASAAIKALFREHDDALAAALGVPLHRGAPKDRDYEIDLLIANEWWDDGAYEDSPRPSR